MKELSMLEYAYLLYISEGFNCTQAAQMAIKLIENLDEFQPTHSEATK